MDERVATCEVELGSPLAELHPQEADVVCNALPRRVLEFRAGRHCARIALGRLGVTPGALLPSVQRAPLWPPGVVGSISHTGDAARGWCGAAVARSERVLGLGLDAELATPLEPELYRLVLRPEELAFVSSRTESERGLWAKLIFSAKEATYKCQFPSSQKFLEFNQVLVEFDVASSTFTARLDCDAPPFRAGFTFFGRFLCTDELLVTAVVLTTMPGSAR